MSCRRSRLGDGLYPASRRGGKGKAGSWPLGQRVEARTDNLTIYQYIKNMLFPLPELYPDPNKQPSDFPLEVAVELRKYLNGKEPLSNLSGDVKNELEYWKAEVRKRLNFFYLYVPIVCATGAMIPGLVFRQQLVSAGTLGWAYVIFFMYLTIRAMVGISKVMNHKQFEITVENELKKILKCQLDGYSLKFSWRLF